MVEFYRMPEEKRLRTAVTVHAMTMGALINGMVRKFGQPGLDLLTEIMTQGTLANVNKAKERGEKFDNIDEFLSHYFSFLYIGGMPAEIAEKTTDRVKVLVCKGMSHCPWFVEDPQACIAMFHGAEKVMLQNLLPQWDADCVHTLTKGDEACEIVFYRKAAAKPS